MMKVSLNQQIDEVRRELNERKGVYARLIASQKMRQSIADFQTQRMEAVLATLEWIQQNEEALKTVVREEKLRLAVKAQLAKGQ